MVLVEWEHKTSLFYTEMKNYIVPKGEKAQHEIKSEILGLTKSIL